MSMRRGSRAGARPISAQRGRLARIERETGVPESIMVAIWGHETNYGSGDGQFRSAARLAIARL